MGPELRSILVGTLGLSVAALASGWLAVVRPIRLPGLLEIGRVRRVAVIAIIIQCAHFGEEWYTGFDGRFPQMLGLAPWPRAFFAGFNLSWIAIWCVSALLMSKQPRLSAFPLWFLGIASAVNGIAHPVLAFASAGYFPGLWTSVLVGVAGVFLLRALGQATE